MYLQNFDVKIAAIKGSENIGAGCLSKSDRVNVFELCLGRPNH